jgi:parallel beta-helix repeat protein
VPAWNLGAIQADNGADWIVERNEIRFNATVGLKVGPRMRVRYNYVHHNGVSGIDGYRADGVLVEANEVAYNNPSNTFVDPSRAGESGLKFFEISNLVVRGNNVHHNNGIGIWCDNAYLNMLIENNTVTLNTLGGIWQEVGYSAVVRNNTVSENGLASPSPGWLEKAGIMVSNSPDVEIYGNTVSNNANGITGMQATGYATTGPYGARVLSNLYIHDNVITMARGKTGLVQNVSDNSYFTSHNNRWAGNDYRLGANSTYFAWSNSNLNEDQWRMNGQDVTGRFVR